MVTTAPASVELQAEALFVSYLQPSERPTVGQIRAAIGRSLTSYGGPTGCSVRFAAEFGEHPDEAVTRMRWALALTSQHP